MAHTVTRSIAALRAFAGLLACSSCTREETDQEVVDAAAQDASTPAREDAAPPAGDGGPALPTAPWRDSSVHVRLTAFSFWTGGMAFERGSQELTEAQQAGLADLKLIPWNGECSEDGLEATLVVEDTDGSSVTYRTAGACDEAGGYVLDVPTVDALIETLPCISASVARDADNQPSTAPHLGANDGCEHGLFGTPPWLMIDVDAPGRTYTIRGLRCQHNRVTMALYDADGATQIAEASAEPAPGCQVIRHVFDSAGSYALHVEATRGDYFLSITHD